MKKILVPTDFSVTAEFALSYALQFCEALPGTIQLLHVVPPDYEPTDVAAITNVVSESSRIQGREKTKLFLDRCLQKTKHQFTSTPKLLSNVEVGLPVSTIVEIAKRDKIDLIIMGTQGEHSRWDRFFGTVSTGVFQQAPCPVLVIPEKVDYQKLEKIAIAIDLKPSDPWSIFRATQALGKQLKHVDCIHVNLTESFKPTEIDVLELKKFYRHHPTTFEIDFHFLAGKDLSDSLNQFVEEKEADALVMVGPHLPAFKKIFLKSETKQMVYKTKVPLLVF